MGPRLLLSALLATSAAETSGAEVEPEDLARWRGTTLMAAGGVLLGCAAGIAHFSVLDGAGPEYTGIYAGSAVGAYPVATALLWTGAAIRGRHDAAHDVGNRQLLLRQERLAWAAAGTGAAVSVASTIAFFAWPTQQEPPEGWGWRPEYRAPGARALVGHLIPLGMFAFSTGVAVGIHHRRLRMATPRLEVRPVASFTGGGVHVRF